MMRILLPPSEGKTAPLHGELIVLSELTAPVLTEPRRQLLDSLTTFCTTQPDQARQVLGLTVGQQEEVLRNQELWTAPTAPAWQVYTGVLYGKLDAPSLTKAQRNRLTQQVWISSALFGFVGFADRIPAYRLSGDTSLPPLGSLAAFWRTYLTPLLESSPELILDLRSGIYVKLAPLPRAVQEQAVTVRVLQKMPAGPPKLITHFNKATKGQLVRAIAQHSGKIRHVDTLAQLAAGLGADVQLHPGSPQELEIVLPVEYR